MKSWSSAWGSVTNAYICCLVLEEWRALESGWKLAAMLVFHRAQGEPHIRADLCTPGLTGCRFALVSMTDRTFPPSKWMRWICSPFVVSFLQTRCQAASSGESAFLEHHLFGQARPVRLFISLKLPGQRAYLRNSFFQSFFFLPLPTFCLRENEMSIFCFLIFFQESKGLLTSSLSPPFLPSSRRYSSEKKRTKYCSCSLS